MRLLRAVIPPPIRALRWRLPWLRRTEAFAVRPVDSIMRALRFTWHDLGTDEVRFSTPDGLRFVSMPNNFSSFVMCVTGTRDPNAWRFIATRLGPGAVFVDAGANIGAYTLPAARLVGPTGRVLAFEAHPHTFGFLARNLDLNGLRNVSAFNQALGAASGEIRLSFKQANPGETHVRSDDEAETTDAVVPMTTLDAALAAQGVGPVDYLKIDVEGFEVPVLRGALGVIAGSPGIAVQTEIEDRHAERYGHRAEEIGELLQGMGLRPHLPDSQGLAEPLEGRLRGDVIWFRP
jgi:FkbM family methyltransferase